MAGLVPAIHAFPSEMLDLLLILVSANSLSRV
jgi:hypothetical protein